ncbi:helicase [Seminavis robusta]|uniref:Helicase n=1 Tax=Seminavis robusta TaxID=568900 RepID=A0A9N8D6A7_9STRA|nr:helicase [Seminavis robusta]|eukprot:Sro17_g012030.1 helicase (698) ;mRNA; f:6331-8922
MAENNPPPMDVAAVPPAADAKAAANPKRRKLPNSTGNGANDGGKSDSEESYQQVKRPRTQARHPRGVPWFTMLERLKQYRVKHGTLNVPRILPDDQKLASWVHYQRYLFHHKTIAEERKAALDALGFEWTIADSKVGNRVSWDQHLAQLKEYKERHGDCLVPYTYKDNKSLAYWVSRQRKDNNKGQLPEDKVAKLNEIGFAWNPTLGRRWSKNKDQRSRSTNWEGQFEKLRAIHEMGANGANGADTRTLIEQDKSLEAWMKNQRYLYSVKRMSADRVAKLDSIGFVWRIGISWNDYLVRLKNHKDTTGTFDNIADPKLLEWVECQRISKYWKELSKERVDQLNAIGFVWESDKVSASQEEWKRMAASQDAQLGASGPAQRAPPKPMLYANAPAGLDEKMPALVGQTDKMPALGGQPVVDPSQEEMTKFLDSVNLAGNTAPPPVAAAPPQRAPAAEVGETNLQEYNIAIHLAGLAETTDAPQTKEEGVLQPVAQNQPLKPAAVQAVRNTQKVEEKPAYIVVDGKGEAIPPAKQEATGAVDPNSLIAAASEQGVTQDVANVAKTEEPSPADGGENEAEDMFENLSTAEKNVVLAEEIVVLREETVKLREDKVKVQAEKLDLHHQIEEIKTKNETLRKEAEDEKNTEEDNPLVAHKKELEAKVKENESKLSSFAAQISEQEGTLRSLEQGGPGAANEAFV